MFKSVALFVRMTLHSKFIPGHLLYKAVYQVNDWEDYFVRESPTCCLLLALMIKSDYMYTQGHCWFEIKVICNECVDIKRINWYEEKMQIWNTFQKQALVIIPDFNYVINAKLPNAWTNNKEITTSMVNGSYVGHA